MRLPTSRAVIDAVIGVGLPVVDFDFTGGNVYAVVVTLAPDQEVTIGPFDADGSPAEGRLLLSACGADPLEVEGPGALDALVLAVRVADQLVWRTDG